MADQTTSPVPDNKPKPWRIPQHEVSHLLGISRSGVYHLMKTDPSFPRPMKDGKGRGARCYFVTEEVETWLNRKIIERDQQAA